MNDALLRKLYYDPSSPSSFGSADKLLSASREINPLISRKEVQSFLSGEFAYTLHRRRVRKFKRNPVVSSFHTQFAQADLIDVMRFKNENDGNQYILTMIDVFSKVAFAVPIKTKSGLHVRDAIMKIFVSYRPHNLQTDEGKEFCNKTVQNCLKTHLVNFFLAKNENIKCAVVERFQRTLMTRISKFFTANAHHRYLDHLPYFVASYNNTFHRSIKMTPLQASKADAGVVFQNLYGFSSEREMLKAGLHDPALKEKDSVRVPKHKSIFEKGYRQTFTDEIYAIQNTNVARGLPTYKLADSRGKPVPGSFYEPELQRITNSDIYRVEILGRRKRGSRREVRVRYVNIPSSQPEWISVKKLQPLS